jgi:ABC-type glycerol-3-phosphate transport system substrate-binding protein
MRVPGKFARIFLTCALGAGLAACGGSGSGAPSSSSSSTPAGSSGGNSATMRTIAANWVAFFNAKTPVNRRVALLEDGSEFAPIIRAQAGSGLAALATAKVTKVTVESASQAKVAYSILISGQPALTQTGVAVLQDGTWKVGVASFCGLLVQENAGSSAKLPAACKGTS